MAKKENGKKGTADRKRSAKKESCREALAAVTATSVARVEDERGRPLLGLRERLDMNRETFARLIPISVRHLANLESGQVPTENVQRRLTELRRVIQALSEVIQKEALGPWMTQPNEAFDGLKPIEVIERGEVDRIWQMIYYVRSGLPF